MPDGSAESDAEFVKDAYEWWEAGATAVGGAASAGVTRSELRALAPLRRPRGYRAGVGQESDDDDNAGDFAMGLRDGVAVHHHHRDDDGEGGLPWWVVISVSTAIGARCGI
jgi:hypothetical protein